MKERQRHDLGRTVFTLPGDILVVQVQDRKSKEQIEFQEKIGRTVEIDTVVTFDSEGALGVDGIGAIMGRAV